MARGQARVAFDVEYFEYDDCWWERQWNAARQRYCWWLFHDKDGSRFGPIWRPRGSLGLGKGDVEPPRYMVIAL